jgi:hypothetical protein
MSIRTAESAWTQNSDGMWTWHPQPEGVRRFYEPLGDLTRMVGVFHEAGHAVVGLVFRMGIDGVFLSPGNDGKFMFHTVWSGSASWTGYTCYLAAGERAADRWLRETGQWTPERAWSVERGARSDRNRAVEAAAEMGRTLDIPAHPWDGWTQVCSGADATLDAHWDRVRAVADALLAKGSLDAAAVARVSGLPNPSA